MQSIDLYKFMCSRCSVLWSRVLEEPQGLHLIEKFLTLYGTLKIITVLTGA